MLKKLKSTRPKTTVRAAEVSLAGEALGECALQLASVLILGAQVRRLNKPIAATARTPRAPARSPRARVEPELCLNETPLPAR